MTLFYADFLSPAAAVGVVYSDGTSEPFTGHYVFTRLNVPQIEIYFAGERPAGYFAIQIDRLV